MHSLSGFLRAEAEAQHGTPTRVQVQDHGTRFGYRLSVRADPQAVPETHGPEITQPLTLPGAPG